MAATIEAITAGDRNTAFPENNHRQKFGLKRIKPLC
jgi:hypothetical protein